MTLPPDLEKKMSEMTEKRHNEERGGWGPDFWGPDFEDGFRACYEHLCEMGPEFDEAAAWKRADKIWPTDFENDESYEFDQKMNWKTGYVNGKRDQHALISAQLAAVKAQAEFFEQTARIIQQEKEALQVETDARIQELEEVARKDYEDMRKFQARFIEADHKLQELEKTTEELRKGRETRCKHNTPADLECMYCTYKVEMPKGEG